MDANFFGVCVGCTNCICIQCPSSFGRSVVHATTCSAVNSHLDIHVAGDAVVQLNCKDTSKIMIDEILDYAKKNKSCVKVVR